MDMNNNWRLELIERARVEMERARRESHLTPRRPSPQQPERFVDMNDADSRLLRQAFLAKKRQENKRVILWLSAFLSASIAGNAMQVALYLEALKHFRQ